MEGERERSKKRNRNTVKKKRGCWLMWERDGIGGSLSKNRSTFFFFILLSLCPLNKRFQNSTHFAFIIFQ